MIDDPIPQPEPSGALVPPRKYPPTAVAMSTPPPPERLFPRVTSQRPVLYRFIYGCMDALDQVGDAVAHALRLR
ncbi:MAG TPA: hypothetical protein VH762_01720 [Gemmatimonadaceae bacterium]|jgi:hypothetical protein